MKIRYKDDHAIVQEEVERAKGWDGVGWYKPVGRRDTHIMYPKSSWEEIPQTRRVDVTSECVVGRFGEHAFTAESYQTLNGYLHISHQGVNVCFNAAPNYEIVLEGNAIKVYHWEYEQ